MRTQTDKNFGIIEKAREYWMKGLKVIPVKGKKPLVSWRKWQAKRQSQSVFESFPWDKADGFALIGGALIPSGYVSAIDSDVKGFPKKVIERGKEIIKKLPDTQTERTPSGGLHLIYLCRQKPKTTSRHRKEFAIELLGENKLIVMAPSQGYTKLDDKSPAIIENLEEAFKDALEKSGIGHAIQKPCDNESYVSKFWFERVDLAAKPFLGKDPPCIRQLLKGVKQGSRNEVLIRLASYLVNFRQIDPQKAVRKTRAWNKFNDPPLEKKELEKTFASAIRGEYNYGCSDHILKSRCNRLFFCSLRKEDEKTKEKQATAEFDSETENKINAEAERILEADNQLMVLEPHLDNVHVGERNNKLTMVVLNLSGKYEDPKMKQIIILKGVPGGGKTSLVRETTTGHNVKEIGRFTAHALDYTNLEGVEILYIKELGNIDEDKSGVSTIKFLSSEDGGYVTEYTTRDEKTGRLTTATNEIPPITLNSTTTRISLDSQLERRGWLIPVDDSEEQTKRVLEWKAKRERQEAEKAMGWRKVTDYEFSREVIKRVIQRMKLAEIIIPFPLTLTRVYSSEFLRLRGDISKIFAFIKLYGQFNLKRLCKAKDDVYAVTPEVAVEALDLIDPIMVSMLVKLEKRTSEILEALKHTKISKGRSLLDGHEIFVRPVNEGDEITKAVREQIAQALHKSYNTIHKRFNALQASGYLSGDDKKPKTFTLLYDVDLILGKLKKESGKLKSPDSLMAEMEKESQEWLNSKCGIQVKEGISKVSSNVKSDEKILSTPSGEFIPHSTSSKNKEDFGKKAKKNAGIEKSPISKEEPTGVDAHRQYREMLEREKREKEKRKERNQLTAFMNIKEKTEKNAVNEESHNKQKIRSEKELHEQQNANQEIAKIGEDHFIIPKTVIKPKCVICGQEIAIDDCTVIKYEKREGFFGEAGVAHSKCLQDDASRVYHKQVILDEINRRGANRNSRNVHVGRVLLCCDICKESLYYHKNARKGVVIAEGNVTIAGRGTPNVFVHVYCFEEKIRNVFPWVLEGVSRQEWFEKKSSGSNSGARPGEYGTLAERIRAQLKPRKGRSCSGKKVGKDVDSAKEEKVICHLCGREISIRQRKMLLPPHEDKKYAHEHCFREFFKESLIRDWG